MPRQYLTSAISVSSVTPPLHGTATTHTAATTHAPATHDAAAPPHAATHDAVATHTAATTHATRQILVIDDSVLIREAAKLGLAAAGWAVLTADSGEEGIALAAGQPDAILLDVVMPGVDGIAVAERLHAMPSTSSVPIVLLTAKDSPEDRERFRGAPVAGVIAKPFDIAGLPGELATLLGWARP